MTATPAGMTYADYLKLDTLLSAQQPLSDLHDEMLFIVIHQTKELWMKQMLHELRLAISLVGEDRFAEAYKAMARISRIQTVMTLSWDVLSTLTPVDYLQLPRRARHLVGLPVGPVSRDRISARAQGAEVRQSLCRGQRGARPARAGAGANRACAKRRKARSSGRGSTSSDGRVRRSQAAWLEIYRDADRWFDLYQLAEKLVDIDDALAAWRHKHVLTVERIIGNKPGTGGSAGAAYLRTTLDEARLPRTVVAQDRTLSFKPLFAKSLGAAPGRLHFAAHSHHLWPDASFEGQVECWEDARDPGRPQMGQGDGRGVARSAGPCRRRAGQRRSVGDRLCVQYP